jgi:hypothetical protein
VGEPLHDYGTDGLGQAPSGSLKRVWGVDLTGLPEGPFHGDGCRCDARHRFRGGSGSPEVALPPPPILFECARPAWRPPVPVVPVVVQPRLVGLKALGALASHPLLVVAGC